MPARLATAEGTWWRRTTGKAASSRTSRPSTTATRRLSGNSGVWSTLEGKVKAAAPSGRDTLYVVTGVLYEGTVKTLSSGSLSVPIPSHFYKCLMKCSFDASGTMTAASGTAFIFTNESHTGEQYNDQRYISTIDAIEQRAGFDFFPNVPSSLQTNAENGTSVLNL